MAILLGREIYGFPKRFGRTFARTDGTDVVVDNRRLLRARWSQPAPIFAPELGERMTSELMPGVFELPVAQRLQREVMKTLPRELPSMLRTTRVFVRKRIQAETSEIVPSFRIDELVEIPFVVESFSDSTAWHDFSVRFGPGQQILTGTAIAVYSARMTFRFAAGLRRRDYTRRGPAAWLGVS
jgi:hypothetical protein